MVAITWITPQEITPITEDTWVDAYLENYVPNGTTGVILHIYCSGSYKIGWRKNGSSDNRTNSLYLSSHFWCVCGIDAQKILELYIDSVNAEVWLVGYFTSEGYFFTNAPDKSLSSTGSWLDIDISGDTVGEDVAIGAMFEVVATLYYQFGFRKNTSSDTRIADIDRHSAAIIGVDGSEICEGYIDNTGCDFFLNGYITSGATFNTNGTDISIATTGTWTDLTALPSGANGGFIEVISGDWDQDYGLRENGSSENITGHASGEQHAWGMVECDGDRLIEGYIDNIAVDFFLIGYSTTGDVYYEVLTETASLSDSITKTLSYGRVLTEILNLTDTLTKVRTIVRTFTETLSMTDTVTRMFIVELLESVSLTDSLTKTITYAEILSELINLSDTLTKKPGIEQSETISITDSYIKTFSTSFTETISLTDTITKTLVYVVDLIESVTLTDSFLKTIGLVKREIISTSDVFSKVFTLQRSFTETLSTTDTLTRILTYVKSLTEILSLVDTRNLSINKSMTLETLSVTDTRTFLTSKFLTETLSTTDILTIIELYNRSLTETISITDSRLFTTGKVVIETINLIDGLARIFTLTRILSETISTTDLLGAVVVILRELTETISMSDTITKVYTHYPLTTLHDVLGEKIKINQIQDIFSQNVAINALADILSEMVEP